MVFRRRWGDLDPPWIVGRIPFSLLGKSGSKPRFISGLLACSEGIFLSLRSALFVGRTTGVADFVVVKLEQQALEGVVLTSLRGRVRGMLGRSRWKLVAD